MAVEYLRVEPGATPDLIAALGQRVGSPLPDDYRNYLTQQNGGRLDNNSEAAKMVFGLGDGLPYSGSMDRMLSVYAGRVPAWLLPVASDEYGNLFAVSLRDQDRGTVWFWDHEEEADDDEAPSEDNIEWKAKSWTEFLDSLQPVSS